MAEYAVPDKRNKGKDKRKNRKKFPYRQGGKQRAQEEI